jgi:hypothetical protein
VLFQGGDVGGRGRSAQGSTKRRGGPRRRLGGPRGRLLPQRSSKISRTKGVMAGGKSTRAPAKAGRRSRGSSTRPGWACSRAARRRARGAEGAVGSVAGSASGPSSLVSVAATGALASVTRCMAVTQSSRPATTQAPGGGPARPGASKVIPARLWIGTRTAMSRARGRRKRWSARRTVEAPTQRKNHGRASFEAVQGSWAAPLNQRRPSSQTHNKKIHKGTWTSRASAGARLRGRKAERMGSPSSFHSNQPTPSPALGREPGGAIDEVD